MRVHPFPFRTRKLSSSVATILGWRRPGKIARRQHKESSCGNAVALFFAPCRRVGMDLTGFALRGYRKYRVKLACVRSFLLFPSKRRLRGEKNPESGQRIGNLRYPNRSVRFGLERRSDRTSARDCGFYGNRNHEACEVRDDASTAPTQREQLRKRGCSFLQNII